MGEYKNYWDFLKQTPRNLMSIILIWMMSISGIVLSATASEFDPEWSRYGFIGVLIIIVWMGWYRPYTIYKRLKG